MTENLEFKDGSPFKKNSLKKLKQFLNTMNLNYTDSIDYSVVYTRGDEIVATGSLSSNILVDFAIRYDMRGENLSIKVITALLYKANERGLKTLFIYTKPTNIKYFTPSGFYELVKTDEVALLCNDKNIINNYIKDIKIKLKNIESKIVGSIVMKADPFTLGHKYLVETAAHNCDLLLVFLVEEGNTYFDFDTRLRLVKNGVSEFCNTFVFGTSYLMVSPLTFPTYFLKGKTDRQIATSNIDLDLKLFSTKIAQAFKITKRFIGSEPYSEVTNIYNERMKLLLPKDGISVFEIQRRADGKEFISATKVRKCFEDGKLECIKDIVPESTFVELCLLLKKEHLDEC